MRLKLELPVATLEKSKVQGSVALAGNDIQITPDSPLLARSRRRRHVHRTRLSWSGAQARALGGDVRLEGGTRGTPAVALPGRQPTPACSCARKAPPRRKACGRPRNWDSFRAWRGTRAGSAAYQLSLGFRRGVPEVSVTSNLQGLALSLPPPLAKPADTVLPLRYENALMREALAVQAGRRGCRTSSRSNSAAWHPWSTCATCPAPSRASFEAASRSGWRPANRRRCPNRA